MTEILLKVALNTINQTKPNQAWFLTFYSYVLLITLSSLIDFMDFLFYVWELHRIFFLKRVAEWKKKSHCWNSFKIQSKNSRNRDIYTTAHFPGFVQVLFINSSRVKWVVWAQISLFNVSDFWKLNPVHENILQTRYNFFLTLIVTWMHIFL